MKSIGRAEFVKMISEKTGVPQTRVSSVVEAYENVVIEQLAEGNEINLRGFGAFKSKIRPAREYFNHFKGENIKKPEARVVRFCPGKSFKQSVDAGNK